MVDVRSFHRRGKEIVSNPWRNPLKYNSNRDPLGEEDRNER